MLLRAAVGTRRFRDELDPDTIEVEPYAESPSGGAPVRQKMMRGEELVGASRGWIYVAQVQAQIPAENFTARLILCHRGAAIPLEAAQIKWQH
jgi:starch phosphorylase